MVQLFRRRQGTSIQTYKHANIVLLYKRDIATQCLFASMYVCLQPISSITAGLIWLNFFCQHPSWSQGGFRPKKFWIWDPVFQEIQKNKFGWNFQVILTLTQICFNTNKFLYQVSSFLDPKSSFFGKIWQNFAKNRFNSISSCDISFFIF